MKRWLKFSTVGLMGIAVQMTTMYLMRDWHYLVSTVIAVELAILHNFVWHEVWTWKDRAGDGRLGRLIRFNGTTGAVSILANVFWMRLLVQTYHIAYMPSSAAAIVLTSAANFTISELLVFRKRPLTC